MYSNTVSSKDEKENVKAWLKKIKKDRFWLAEQCGVHKRTVDSWFFKKSEIPAKALLTIYDLMFKQGYLSTEEELVVDESGMVTLELEFDSEQYQIIKTEAERRGLDAGTYCSELIQNAFSTDEEWTRLIKFIRKIKKNAKN
mgnify:FL=1